MKQHRLLTAAIGVATALFVSIPACTTPQLVCDAIQECEHSNDYTHELCKISWSKKRDVASAYECDTEFSDYAECAMTADCDDNRYQIAKTAKPSAKTWTSAKTARRIWAARPVRTTANRAVTIRILRTPPSPTAKIPLPSSSQALPQMRARIAASMLS